MGELSVTDQQLAELLTRLTAELQELREAPQPKYKTDMVVRLPEMHIPLMRINSVSQLLTVAAMIKTTQTSFNVLAEEWNVQAEFSAGGKSVDDTLADIRTRIEHVKNVTMRDKLNRAIKKLKDVASQELRARQIIADVTKDLLQGSDDASTG